MTGNERLDELLFDEEPNDGDGPLEEGDVVVVLVDDANRRIRAAYALALSEVDGAARDLIDEAHGEVKLFHGAENTIGALNRSGKLMRYVRRIGELAATKGETPE